jgi:rhodanese-related sulfurtransferase
MGKHRFARKELESIPRISSADARNLVDSGQGVLVDTRDERYYQEAHAVGAISVPLEEIQASAELSGLGSVRADQKLIFYCT